ncbi:MAG: hypothetical protein J0I48_16990 [Devosia sp.]|mgnify:CR=1 FL=1|uniref:hypothetical protein n=1 Tax=Devosia sp. 66-22 TaxID=1895753 RepID=UPI001AC1A678|nr:hypothetical protein [Devosia sp. 66-22]MBN9347865.1 hypothetical protein [Devosia sp.]
MTSGVVFAEFTIAAGDRARFAGWHTNEHARERLEIPGVRGVQRYVDIADELHFCCLYRANDVGVFASPGYASLPDRASATTREIASGITGTRFLGEAFGSQGNGQGGLMMRSRRSPWSHQEAEACLAASAEELALGTISRVEILKPGQAGPKVDDLAWIIILEGSTIVGLGEATSRLQTQGKAKEIFRLEHAMSVSSLGPDTKS